ncbi:MAG: flagellar assembly protein FliX [Rickettsiales bacterium]
MRGIDGIQRSGPIKPGTDKKRKSDATTSAFADSMSETEGSRETSAVSPALGASDMGALLALQEQQEESRTPEEWMEESLDDLRRLQLSLTKGDAKSAAAALDLAESSLEEADSASREKRSSVLSALKLRIAIERAKIA